ncbi:MAG: hypothetical protein HWN67_04945 [Candidatus Helarchaeota archaeon]|nr:hypothetical protein [Candidatus Helarchaeota archaeon]
MNVNLIKIKEIVSVILKRLYDEYRKAPGKQIHKDYVFQYTKEEFEKEILQKKDFDAATTYMEDTGLIKLTHYIENKDDWVGSITNHGIERAESE